MYVIISIYFPTVFVCMFNYSIYINYVDIFFLLLLKKPYSVLLLILFRIEYFFKDNQTDP